jgi:glycosyltransferase involved in cell wall biosynthesis
VSVALPAVLAGWTLGKRMVIRTGGDFVWEAYVERTKEKVLLSDFYPPAGGKPRSLSRKERMLVWLQKHVVFRLADKIVFNTAWQRDVWREPYRIPDSKTAVIENEYKQKTHEHRGGDVFLSAWRPTAFKNIDTLEQAYAIAKKQYPEMRLEIYKDIPREELHEKMRTARALVIPSLSELGPNMAMEALSMGLPVLLTEDCGARDRLEDFVVWIDPKNPNNIAECMTELMDADAYNAVRSHLEEFTFVHTYDDIAQEFLTVLK